MRHVVLCWELGAGYGHLVPLRALGHRLLARGHRVTVIVPDPALARDLPGEDGLEWVAAPRWTRPTGAFPLSQTYAQNLLRNGYGDAASLHRRLTGWRALLAELRPDLLVCDHAPTALLAARGDGVPRAALGMGFTVPPRLSPMPGLQPWLPVPPSYLEASEGRVLERVNPVLRQAGVPALATMADVFDGAESWLHTFAEMDHHAERPGGEFLGMSLGDVGGPAPAWPDAPGRRVFVYLSATNRFLRPVLEGLRARGASVLAFVRGLDPREAARLAAPGVTLLSRLVDLDAVARECDVAVTQGGSGSLATLLLRGVRVLICPLELEQTLLGYRLASRRIAWMAPALSPGVDVAADLDRLLGATDELPGLTAFARRHESFDRAAAAAEVVRRCERLLGLSASASPAVPLPLLAAGAG